MVIDPLKTVIFHHFVVCSPRDLAHTWPPISMVPWCTRKTRLPGNPRGSSLKNNRRAVVGIPHGGGFLKRRSPKIWLVKIPWKSQSKNGWSWWWCGDSPTFGCIMLVSWVIGLPPVTPSIFMEFSMINQSFWDTSILGHPHIAWVSSIRMSWEWFNEPQISGSHKKRCWSYDWFIFTKPALVYPLETGVKLLNQSSCVIQGSILMFWLLNPES